MEVQNRRQSLIKEKEKDKYDGMDVLPVPADSEDVSSRNNRHAEDSQKVSAPSYKSTHAHEITD